MNRVSLNETHDPTRRSWVMSANTSDTDFPLQNLPFCVFKRRDTPHAFGIGVGIGEYIVDLRQLQALGLAELERLSLTPELSASDLNLLMAAGADASAALRRVLWELLSEGYSQAERIQSCLVPHSAAQLALPARIGDYTDFYASIDHATNVGKLFRPDNPLLPNYQWVPIAYHGRSSSIFVSGQDFHRPIGQCRQGEATPLLQPSQRMDFELEVGIFIGAENAPGSRIPIHQAESHVFGLCLLNDWSARDIQAWEYQPLGPFLGKNFATTISPWVVTLEALAPFRQAYNRPAQDPQPLPYLQHANGASSAAIDIHLEVLIQTARMRAAGLAPERLARTNFHYAYWTLAQMITHHSVNGCALKAGDLCGSGTMSGPALTQAGSLLELTHGGKHTLSLSSGECRTFLEDGDCVSLRGWCEGSGKRRIGFGSASATLLPAQPFS